MDRPTAVQHATDGQSSFFAQRGAVADGRPRENGVAGSPRPPSSQISEQERQEAAKRFEDEKRRITASLFGKQDERGDPLQRYISHIRVVENAGFPSAPPPPEYCSPEHFKERYIILSMKNLTGRLHMHKARQNPDGTFQIGKSWALDEVQSVEIFTPALARTAEERERAEWGGPLGFVLTMLKPYYWRADKLLEKEHFILAVLRVFYKLTKGRLPEMIGFSERERQRIINSIQPTTPGTPSEKKRDPQPAPLQVQDRSSQQQRRPSDNSSVNASRTASLTSAAPSGPPSAGFQPSPSPGRQQWSQFGDRRPSAPSADQWPLAQPVAYPSALQTSQNQYQVNQGQAPSALRPQSSRSNVVNPSRPEVTSYGESTLSQTRNNVSVDNSSEPTASLFSSTANRWKPEGVPNMGTNSAPDTGTPQMPPASLSTSINPQTLPERRRPPLRESDSQRSIRNDISTASPLPLQIGRQSREVNSPFSNADTNSVGVGNDRIQNTHMPSNGAASVNGTTFSEELSSPSGFLEQLGTTNGGSLQPLMNEKDEVGDTSPAPTSPVDSGPKYRPGLGPMMGKKSGDILGKTGSTAPVKAGFKPRAGGAGERLLRNQNTDDSQSNAGAFTPAPAPASRPKEVREEEVPRQDIPIPESTPEPKPNESTREEVMAPPPIVTQGLESPSTNVQPIHEQYGDNNVSSSGAPAETETRGTEKTKQRSDIVARSLATLEIDPYIFEGRELEYDDALADFGWDENILQAKHLDSIQSSLRREIARIEAGSWLGHSEHKDEPVAQVGKMLDKAIAECDVMDRLLTLYSVELSTLNDDIAYIEAQSQGLQVQTANQKLLQTELQTMVDTISIGGEQLAPLRNAPLQDSRGLADIETSLLLLYHALSTIDPSIFAEGNYLALSHESTDKLSNMRALQERKNMYLTEAHAFMTRLREYANPLFGMAFQRTRETVKRGRGSSDMSPKLDLTAYGSGRTLLWQYNPLMIFARRIDRDSWQDLMSAYEVQARAIYSEEFRDFPDQWKKRASKVSVEEQEAMFTNQDHDSADSGLSIAARKLTVKRTQTSGKTTRLSTDKRSGRDNQHSSRLEPYEVFASVLNQTTAVIFSEQNFIVDFFHASSLDPADFEDAVKAAYPQDRQGTDTTIKKPVETDRTMGIAVGKMVGGIFTDWTLQMNRLMEWATTDRPFQAVGIIVALERRKLELEDSNQVYLLRELQQLYDHLRSRFTKFVDDTISSLENMKISITKRNGIHPSVQTFPNFSAFVESMLPPANGPEQLEARQRLDEAYRRICKAIFDSLKAASHNIPTNAGYGGATDPEDKGALNYHITIMEHMFFFYSEVAPKGDAVLGEWCTKATVQLGEHQEHYVNAIIRRPLGKILDFIETTDALTSARHQANTQHSNQARSVLKSAIKSYDSKDIEKLRKRIQKHFGESDYPGTSQLINQVTAECERKYYQVLDRIQKLAEGYENPVTVDISREEIAQGFKRSQSS